MADSWAVVVRDELRPCSQQRFCRLVSFLRSFFVYLGVFICWRQSLASGTTSQELRHNQSFPCSTADHRLWGFMSLTEGPIFQTNGFNLLPSMCSRARDAGHGDLAAA